MSLEVSSIEELFDPRVLQARLEAESKVHWHETAAHNINTMFESNIYSIKKLSGDQEEHEAFEKLIRRAGFYHHPVARGAGGERVPGITHLRIAQDGAIPVFAEVSVHLARCWYTHMFGEEVA